MSVLYKLKKILGMTDDLVDAAQSGDSKEFARIFGYSTIFYLSIPIPDTLDPSPLSQHELMNFIEKAANVISQQTEHTAFTYSDGSTRFFPIFSSDAATQLFIPEYLKSLNRIIPFLILSIPGSQLTSQLKCVDQVVLNPKSTFEYFLTERDVEEITKLWAD